MDFVREPAKSVPVAYDADVAVAGAGASGVFAAIAAARLGARTVLVDRFGEPGGTIAPGLLFGRLLVEPAHVPHGYRGIPREFIERHAAMGGRKHEDFQGPYVFQNCTIASYLLLRMLRESGVILMLSAYASDPLIRDGHVRGLFVESKSGRQAVTAKVVIDATGEADLARRAGVPVLRPSNPHFAHDKHSPTGMAIFYAIAGVDWDAYQAYVRNHAGAGDDDREWALRTLGEIPQAPLLRFVRTAWERGEYRLTRPIEGIPIEPVPEGHEGDAREFGTIRGGDTLTPIGGGIVGGRIKCIRGVDAGDGRHIAELEAQVRMYIFETARFWMRYVPGFAESHLLMVAPFLASRGGPCIEGDYTVTVSDVEAGRRFPDNLFVFRPSGVKFVPRWTEFPYRAMIPRRMDGLLAVGRSASCVPDTLLRGMHMAPHMGQAGGTAAALSAKSGVEPRHLDVKTLQRALLDADFHLGDSKRLAELGLR